MARVLRRLGAKQHPDVPAEGINRFLVPGVWPDHTLKD